MRFLVFVLALLASPLRATEVDIELALMVDVSRSMAAGELELQRRGYAEAISSDEVVNAILNGFTGRIALTYVEWAGNGTNREVIPWTLVDSREVAEEIAAQLRATRSFGMRRTSISGAIRYAIQAIEENDFEGLRRVIDISGDGPNNQGGLVTNARDRALAQGFVINGLPLMTQEGNSFWTLEDLDLYYEACVIGGPGAFVIPVRDWKEFPLAVRRKIVLELVGPPEATPVARRGLGPDGYDCLIGEKMREEWERLNNEF
ncbi:MAG: DUF1194 domain-containing protein [Paracoccaceae bacterium]|nr:DUF1194 domain-containing protein [Paracoccaceae bacterium]